jgi:hypothetical protein
MSSHLEVPPSSEELEPLHILDLPSVLLEEVLCLCDGPSVARAACVCKALQLASSPTVWRRLCVLRWGGDLPTASLLNQAFYAERHSLPKTVFAVVEEDLAWPLRRSAALACLCALEARHPCLVEECVERLLSTNTEPREAEPACAFAPASHAGDPSEPLFQAALRKLNESPDYQHLRAGLQHVRHALAVDSIARLASAEQSDVSLHPPLLLDAL